MGPSGYVDAIPAYHDGQYERDVGPQNPPDSPHNWILQAASAGGVLLALLAVALAGWTILTGWRAVRRRTGSEAVVVAGLLAGLTGYAVTLLFHFTTPGTAPLAALYAGALLSQPIGAGGGPRRSALVSASRLAAAAYGVLAVVLVAAAFAEIPLRQALLRAAAGDLSAANHDFDLARTLRPWDPGVAQIATHAYAVLAAHGRFASGCARVAVGVARARRLPGLGSGPSGCGRDRSGARAPGGSGRPAADCATAGT